MDCTSVNDLFTGAELKAIGAAITTIALAITTLGGAYAVKTLREWLSWKE